MTVRTWLLVGTVIDLVLFPLAVFMAFNAVTLAMTYPESGFVLSVALLFQAWAAFCLICPFMGWRIHRKRPLDLNAVIMVAAPLVLGVFLGVFLYST
jgi:hypothetical protein